MFHSLVEGFSIVVACGVFMFAWNSRKFLEDDYFLVLGTAFIFSGIFDMFHTALYPRMGSIRPELADISIQLWVAARIVQALAFVIAPFYVGRKVRIQWLVVFFTGLFLLLSASILVWKNFPWCFVLGEGLTDFKIYTEYGICLVFLISIYLMFTRKDKFDHQIFQYMLTATILTILAEVVFTLYHRPGEIVNVIGHYLKLASFYLIYKAVLVTGYKKPYDLLFRNLKMSESAYKKEKEFAESLLNTAQAIILVLDPRGRILLFNPYFENISGYKLEEVKGKEWFSSFLPEDIQLRVKALFKDAIADIPTFGNINPIVTKSGEYRYIEWYSQSLRDETGNLSGLLAIGQDVTKRRQAELALRESEEKFRQLFTAESDAAVVYETENGKVTEVNDAALCLYEYTREEFLEKQAEEIIADLEDYSEYTILDTNTETGGIPVEVHRKKDGSLIPVEVSEGSFQFRGQSMTVRVIRDISQRVKMEKQILQSNSELSNFAYMVSHDLKSPLGIIAGYLEVINEEPASFNEHYQTIIKQIDWAGKFIDRLLKLSRAGIVIDKKNMVNVRTLVEDTLYQLNTAEMPLVVNYSTPLPDITGDPDKLSQVFLNLISNSIKHQDAQKEQLVLEISHRQEDNHDLIIYRDNGAGIKRELLHRIFEAGFTSRKGDGTGFGLAISRKIIEAHGGIMRAESQGEGQGAEFYIKLPR